jgi:phosphohistidine phosphatase
MEKDIIGKKPYWMYLQSGVIPLLLENGDLKTVLITSTADGTWIFPKGVIEKNMTAKDSAAKEALEEAGISGLVYEDEIGNFEYFKWSGTCTVKMFLMKVDEIRDEWEGKNERERMVCEIKIARDQIRNLDIKILLEKAVSSWNTNNTSS